MTIHIIGFPDAIAQDLVHMFNGTIVPLEAWAQSSDCELCIVDGAQSEALLCQLTETQQPAIVIGGRAVVAQSAAHIEACAKPFRLEKLRSMVDRMIVSHPAIMLGTNWQFYPDYRYISSHGKPRIELTDKESDLLHLLYQQRPEAVDKEQLLQTIWGYDAAVDTKTLETHIYRLRTKLEPLLQDGMELVTTDIGYVWQQK